MHFHHWVIWGTINGLVIYLGGLIFPNAIVLGNATVSVFAAVVLATLVMTLIISLLPIVMQQLSLTKLTVNQKYLLYAIVNISVLWVSSRLALVFGLGLSSKFTAITLGLVLTIAQYLYWGKAVK